MADAVVLDVQDDIGTITFNRPEKRNALTAEIYKDLAECVNECRDREDVRVAILTGAGKAFCAGGDLSGMGSHADNRAHVTKQHIWEDVQAFPKMMATFDKPIIAAVNGAATGAGMDYAMACDIRVAGQSAKFAETYARLGLLPGGGGAYFLPRLVGKSQALELLLTAEFIDADRALEIGLVNHVFPDAELLDKTRAIATKIAALPPFSIRHIKRMVHNCAQVELATALDLVSSHIAIAKGGEDHLEAVAAFKEKRAATFKGF